MAILFWCAMYSISSDCLWQHQTWIGYTGDMFVSPVKPLHFQESTLSIWQLDIHLLFLLLTSWVSVQPAFLHKISQPAKVALSERRALSVLTFACHRFPAKWFAGVENVIQDGYQTAVWALNFAHSRIHELVTSVPRQMCLSAKNNGIIKQQNKRQAL